MRTKNAQPNAEQKKWRNWLGEQGCFFTGEACQLHHMFGAAKKAKIDGFSQNIGEWGIIGLSYWHHMCPENPDCVDNFKKRFIKKYGYTEKEIFEIRAEQYGQLPPEIVEAVMRY
jgi:hypothetical protein